jgi:hypothetical protein
MGDMDLEDPIHVILLLQRYRDKLSSQERP